MRGQAGLDFLSGRGSADELYGGRKIDEIRGHGGAGKDTLIPGTGADFVDAGNGDDTILIVADETRDFIDCGEGVDVVTAEGDAADAQDAFSTARRPPDLPTAPEHRHRTVPGIRPPVGRGGSGVISPPRALGRPSELVLDDDLRWW